MKISSLRDIFILEVQDLYSAEQQLMKALPMMAEKAGDDDLKTAFEDHLEETTEHVARLEQVAEQMDFDPSGKTCKGMQGLLAEGEEVMKLDESPYRDLALISAAQRVEHYEMAGYGTVRSQAEQLINMEVVEDDEVVDVLQETLDEEAATDERLTELAEEIMANLEEEATETAE